MCKLINNIYSILKGQKGESGRPGIPGSQVFFFFYGKWINESHNWTRLRESYLQIKVSEEKGRCSVHPKCLGWQSSWWWWSGLALIAWFVFIFPCWYSLWLWNLIFNAYVWPSTWLTVGTSLVVLWLGLCLLVQEAQFQSLAGSWDLTSLSQKSKM